jgi:DnaJ family protein C protein 28
MPQFSIEEIIRQAIQEGKFDDLPGKGKPLDLDQNPHQDPDWRVAHHLLQSGGFSLPWIEKLGEIDDNLQQARKSLARSWAWVQNGGGEQLNTADWQASIDLFEERIQVINEQIRTYNLEVPNPRFQLPLVEIQLELEQVMNKEDF